MEEISLELTDCISRPLVPEEMLRHMFNETKQAAMDRIRREG